MTGRVRWLAGLVWLSLGGCERLVEEMHQVEQRTGERARDALHGLESLPPEDQEAALLACLQEVLGCPTREACEEVIRNGRPANAVQAIADANGMSACLERRVATRASDPTAAIAPGAAPATLELKRAPFGEQPEEASGLPVPLLAAGAVGGLVVTLGAAGALLLWRRDPDPVEPT